MSAPAGSLHVLRIAMFTTALAALPWSAANAASSYRVNASAPEQSDQVNCLIPGQIKRLDSHTSFLSARRVIRTTRQDCRDRGGEVDSQRRARKGSNKRSVDPETTGYPPPGAGY